MTKVYGNFGDFERFMSRNNKANLNFTAENAEFAALLNKNTFSYFSAVFANFAVNEKTKPICGGRSWSKVLLERKLWQYTICGAVKNKAKQSQFAKYHDRVHSGGKKGGLAGILHLQGIVTA
jgi:hypothetical protein